MPNFNPQQPVVNVAVPIPTPVAPATPQQQQPLPQPTPVAAPVATPAATVAAAPTNPVGKSLVTKPQKSRHLIFPWQE